MKYLLLILMFISCQKEDAPKPVSDPTLQKYVDAFYKDAALHGYAEKKDVIVIFSTQHTGWQYSANYNGVIEINKNAIDSKWPGKYRSSVYREMANIILHKSYITDTNTMHTMIMNIQFCPCEDDGSLWESIVNKLFQN